MFAPGDTVICLDAHWGAHFLRVGEPYVVDHVRGSDGWLSLVGMAAMWSPDRFRLLREAGAPIDPRSVTDPVYRRGKP
jgi:hypothetical protein